MVPLMVPFSMVPLVGPLLYDPQVGTLLLLPGDAFEMAYTKNACTTQVRTLSIILVIYSFHLNVSFQDLLN